MNDETFSVEMGGLFPLATDYVCCVEAIYGSYVADKVCTLLRFPNATASTSGESDLSAYRSESDNTISIVGGVLGFVIAVLLILLVIFGGALLLLLQSKSVHQKRCKVKINKIIGVDSYVYSDLIYILVISKVGMSIN